MTQLVEMAKSSFKIIYLAAFVSLWAGVLTGCGPSQRATPEAASLRGGDDILPGTGRTPATPDGETLTKPLPSDPMGVSIHTLSNGMKVYISTNRDKPRISAWIAVRAGSRMDPSNSTGLAHYLEHMLFKGSSRLGSTDFTAEKPLLAQIANLYGKLRQASDEKARAEIFAQIDSTTQKASQYAIPNEFDQLYANLGIVDVNAFTSDEQTVYTCELPKNRFSTWAEVEADRFRDPQFRLFWPELEAVYEEKNRSLDNPGSRMNEALGLALYPQHPYGTQPTIGITEHLKSPAYADMEAFFAKYYMPNNMAIVLAGDIDPATALPVLEKQFGSWQARTLAPDTIAPLPPVSGRKEVAIAADGEQTIWMAWHTVPLMNADQPALEVMDMLMDNASTGLLNLNLVLTQKVPKAFSENSFYNQSGFWMLGATARDGQSHEELEKLLLAEIDHLKAGNFAQSDIDAVVLHREIEEKTSLESNESRVSKMTEAFIAHQRWTDATQHLNRLRAVTREDVLRVAKKYLTDNYVVVKRVKGKFEPPKITKPAITPIPLAAKQSEFAKNILAQTAEPVEPQWPKEGQDYARETLPSGPLVTAPNRLHDLFTVSWSYEIGEAQLPKLCFALKAWQQSGRTGQSAKALKQELFALGATVRGLCSARSSSIVISGIDRNFDKTMSTVRDWLARVAIDPAVLPELARNEISQRADGKQEPRTIARALREYANWGKQSEFLIAPSDTALKNSTPAELAAVLAKFVEIPHRTAYFGPQDYKAVAAALTLGSGKQKKFARQVTRYRKVKASTVFLTSRPTAQSQISLVIPHPAASQQDQAMAELYAELTSGGMGAIIFQEIREARGLAYSAYAVYQPNDFLRDDSGLIAALGTQSDKTNEALEVLVGLLRTLPVTPERLAIGKRAIDERYRATRPDPRMTPSLVFGWDDLGYKEDPRPTMWKMINEKGTLEAITAFAKRVAQGSIIVSIMGDASRFDQKALRKIGEVKTVSEKELFSY